MCGEAFTPNHSSNMFCSVPCRKKGRKPVSAESKKKVSEALKRHYASRPQTEADKLKTSLAVGRATKGSTGKTPESILELSSRTVGKILRRLKIGCSLCGWREAACDLHHIAGRKIANASSHDNLTYICPNCHRKVHTGLVPVKDLVSLTIYIGNRWKELYFG